MRPVRKDASPQRDDFKNYDDAKPLLMSRLGKFPAYCSYCERAVYTGLAVEHLKPKAGINGSPGLKGNWGNFLLACINCNSTKSDKKVDFDKLLFPDRDNTFYAFKYTQDGKINVSVLLSARLEVIGRSTLALTGLDKLKSVVVDENGNEIPLDRVAQRQQCWMLAEKARESIKKQPTNALLKESWIENAQFSGYFSVWMTVFADDSDMRLRLIRAFPGTEASGCFDMTTGESISPAPNPDNLQHGGKI